MPIIKIDEAHALGDGVVNPTTGRFAKRFVVWFVSDSPQIIDSAGVLNDPEFAAARQSADTGQGIALCVGRQATFRDRIAGNVHTQIWDVVLEYQKVADLPWGVFDFGGNSQPFQDYQNADLDGKAIVNAVGDLMQPIPPVVLGNQTFFVRVNHKQFHFLTRGIKLHFVNSANWHGLDARRVMFAAQHFAYRPLVQPLPSWAYPIRDYWYYEVAYHFELHANVWTPTELLNVGSKYKVSNDDGTDKLVLVKDGNNVTHSGQCFLDKEGFRIVPVPGFEFKPTYLPYRFHWDCDFNELFDFIKYLGD